MKTKKRKLLGFFCFKVHFEYSLFFIYYKHAGNTFGLYSCGPMFNKLTSLRSEVVTIESMCGPFLIQFFQNNNNKNKQYSNHIFDSWGHI